MKKEKLIFTPVSEFMGRVFKISSKIVAGAPAGSLLSLSVMRLGIFHLLMYYLGAIGYFMSGSRQKNLSTIYAPLSVEKIMEGHAFARAVRGLLLVTGSLATGILEGVQLNSGGILPYAKPCHLYIEDIEKLNEKRIRLILGWCLVGYENLDL